MQHIAPIRDKEFPLGYNDKYKPEDLPPGFCVDAINCFLEERKIKERNGYSLVGNDTNEVHQILGLGYLETPSVRHLLRVGDDSSGNFGYIRYWTGSGNWIWISTRTLTKDLPTEMETAQGKTYMTNGTDTVLSWDGTTLAQVAAFPKAKYIKWFHNYMFAFNVSGNRSRLYFSNLGDPETWGASDYLDIAPGDSDQGTGLNVLGDELIIGKGHRVKAFSGWSAATFSVKDVSDRLAEYGVASHRTMLNIGNDLLFLSFAGDVPHFRSLQRTRYAVNIYGGIISDDIENTMRGLNASALSVAAGLFDGKRAWFFVPNGSSTINDLTLCYDTVTKGWTKHTGINASVALIANVTGAPVRYFGESRAQSKVYKLDSSNSDNGSAISFQFTTRRFQPDFKRKHKYKYLYLHAETIGNVDVGVKTSVDGFTYDNQGNLNLQGTSSTFPLTFDAQLGSTDVKRKRFELGYQPRYNIQLQLTKNDTNSRAVIRDYEFEGYAKGLRDA